MAVYENWHDAYIEVITNVLRKPQYISSPRGQKTHECLNYQFVVKNSQTDIAWHRTGFPERAETYNAYWNKELQWYLSGSLIADTAPAKFWKTIADKDGNVTSNYGYMTLFEQKYGDRTGVERVVEILRRDPDSRQAVLHYGESRHFWEGNKDTPCCVMNQFFVRNNELVMIVQMRSNDVWRGLGFDLKWFSYLHALIGAKLNTALGAMHYGASSMHAYESDFANLERTLSFPARQ